MPHIVLLTLKLIDNESVVIARQRVREIAGFLKFDVYSRAKIATAVSEISRHALLCAEGCDIEYSVNRYLFPRTFKIKMSGKGLCRKELKKIDVTRIVDKFSIRVVGDEIEVVAEMKLPLRTPLMTAKNVAKITKEIAKMPLNNAAEEVQEQSRELLYVLELVSKGQAELEKRVKKRTERLEIVNQQLHKETEERKRIEEWIHQHQQEIADVEKMNSLGELASAFAHELNQPLAALSTYTQGSIRYLKSSDYEKEEVLNIMKLAAKEAKYAGDIIHRMKSFIRHGDIIKQNARLNKIIKETVLLMSTETEKYHAQIKLELSEPLPLVELDVIQTQQVFINLIRTSLTIMREAKTFSPTITIKSSISGTTDVIIEMVNNGPCSEAKDLRVLFEPYFTTKKYRKGIGLSVARSILEAHGGKLLAHPHSSGGTCFQCFWPIPQGENNE